MTTSQPVSAEERKVGTGSFTYYECEPGWFMFSCYPASMHSVGCHTVGADGLAANIAALEKHRINRTANNQYWDFAAREWRVRS